MAVNVNAGAGRAGFKPRQDIQARVQIGIIRLAHATDIADARALPVQTLAEEPGAGLIGIARRVDGGKTDQIARQRNQFISTCINAAKQSINLRMVDVFDRFLHADQDTPPVVFCNPAGRLFARRRRLYFLYKSR